MRKHHHSLHLKSPHMDDDCAQSSFDSSTRSKVRAVTLGLIMGASAAALASGQVGQSGAHEPPRPGSGLVDWVADPSHEQAGSGCLASDGVVSCNEPDVTARRGGVGSCHGLRVLDGLTGGDDRFAASSRFEDLGSWTIVTGNVGSKHDLAEVRLVN